MRNTPGVTTRKERFKKLVGWGKRNGRKPTKPKTSKRKKLSRKLRTGRTKRNKN